MAKSKLIFKKFVASRGIKKLQAILKLDLEYFFKGGFFTAVQQSAGSLAGVLISFAFARFASKELFGKYNLILSILAITSLFSLSGFTSAIVQSTLKKYEKALTQSVVPRLKGSFLGSIFLLAIGLFYFFNNQQEVGKALVLIAFFFPLLYSFNGWFFYLQAKKLFSKAAFYGATTSLFFCLAIIASLLLTKNVILITLTYVLTYSSLHFLFFQKTKTLIPVKAKKDPEIKRYALLITLTNALNWIASNIDKVVLASILGYEQVAVYSIAKIIPQGMNKNLKALMTVPSIKIIPHNIKKNVEVIKTHFGKIFLIGLFIAFAGWFGSPFLMRIIYGSVYRESVFYTRLLMLSFVLAPLNLLWQNIVVFQKKTKQIVFLSFFPSLPKIFLYLLLTFRLKILGVVLAEITGSLMLFFYFLFLFYKKSEKR